MESWRTCKGSGALCSVVNNLVKKYQNTSLGPVGLFYIDAIISISSIKKIRQRTPNSSVHILTPTFSTAYKRKEEPLVW